jgi:electron transfer flavoprotein alpha subunit
VVSEAFAFAGPPRTRCGARTRQASSGGKDIEKARVLVSGGAGLGGPEPFQLLGEIADLVDGAVAASRVACDAGWVPTAIQVGLTGKSVAPDLYLAVGISGATHHLAGCSSAQVIAVINSDPSAPFFRLANFGVVGDWKEVLPAFRDALKEKLGGASRVA